MELVRSLLPFDLIDLRRSILLRDATKRRNYFVLQRQGAHGLEELETRSKSARGFETLELFWPCRFRTIAIKPESSSFEFTFELFGKPFRNLAMPRELWPTRQRTPRAAFRWSHSAREDNFWIDMLEPQSHHAYIPQAGATASRISNPNSFPR